MKISYTTVWLLAMTLTCVPVMAQDEAETLEQRMAEAAMLERSAAENERAMMVRSADVEVRMRKAEAAMEIAVRELADISMTRLPRGVMLDHFARLENRPLLGISIGGGHDDQPVDGVRVIGVSPGGAAAEAGMRAEDVITLIGNESLKAENGELASGKLMAFMNSVDAGDEVTVEYLRGGKRLSAELMPQAMDVRSFRIEIDDRVEPTVAAMQHNLRRAGISGWLGGSDWLSQSSGFGALEMVTLTPQLGRYFGTDEGLLIVRAPEGEDLQLQEGDVIREIDGRKPTSVSHALRILGSYESGETVKIQIMRDKRKKTVKIEVPDNRQSSLWPEVVFDRQDVYLDGPDVEVFIMK